MTRVNFFQLAYFCLLISQSALAQSDSSAIWAGSGETQSHGPTVSAQNGHLNYSIPLPVLPGRAGLTPELQLSYSQSPSDRGAGFGVGWSLPVSAIELLTENGILEHGYSERMDEDGDLKYRLALDGQRLSYKSSDSDTQRVSYYLERHQQKIEVIRHDRPFTFKIRDKNGLLQEMTLESGFEVIQADGRRQIYSGDPLIAEGTELAGVDESAPLIEHHFISKWPLVYDILVGGEAIQYDYELVAGRSVLKSISFAGGRSRYILNWSDRSNGPTSQAMGFPQESRFLYSSLTACFDAQPQTTWFFAYQNQKDPLYSAVSCSGDKQGVLDNLNWLTVKSYVAEAIDWVRDAFGGTSESTERVDSLYLNKLHRFGSQIDESSRKATLHFAYSEWAGDATVHVYDAPSFKNIIGFGYNGNSELLDVNHDGALDLVRLETSKSAAYLNAGSAFDRSNHAESVEFTLKKDGRVISPQLNETQSSPEIYLYGDLNGDGWNDIVGVNAQNEWIAYLQDFEGRSGYNGRTKNMLLRDGNKTSALLVVKNLFEEGRGILLDVNGDGRSDILHPMVGADARVQWIVYLNKTLRKGRDIVFEKKSFPFPFYSTDPNLLRESANRFVDMNGDGLEDFVRIVNMSGSKTGLCVYENMGRSNFAQGQLFQKAVSSDREPCAASQFYEVPDLGGVEGRLNSLWTIDLNSDGQQDFADLSADGRKLYYWLAKAGRGGYDRKQVIELNEILRIDPMNKYNSRVVDIDQDGIAEILVYDVTDHKVKVIDFNRNKENAQAIPPGILRSVASEHGLSHRFLYTSAHQELARERRSDFDKRWTKRGHPYASLLVKYVLSQSTVDSSRDRAFWYQYMEPYWDQEYGSPLGYRQTAIWSPGAMNSQAGNMEWNIYDLTEGAAEKNRIIGGELKQQLTYEVPWTDGLEASHRNRLQLKGSELLDDLEEHDIGVLLRRVSQNNFIAKEGVDAGLFDFPNRKPRYFYQLQEVTEEICDSTKPNCEEASISKNSFQYENAKARLKSTVYTQPAVGAPFGKGLSQRSLQTELEYDEESESLLGISTNISRKTVRSLGEGKLLEDMSTVYEKTFGLPAVQRSQTLFNFSNDELPAELAKEIPADAAPPKSVKYSYDDFGNQIEMSDELGLIRKVQYGQAGVFPLVEENALGQKTYSCYGKIDCAVNQSELLADMPQYSAQITLSLSPSGDWKRFDYDSLGRASRVRTALGLEQSLEYDQGSVSDLPRRLTVERSDSKVLRTLLETFDEQGNLLYQLNDIGQAQSQAVSIRQTNRSGRVTFESHPEIVQGSPESYFTSKKKADLTLQHGTQMSYDGLGRSILVIKSGGEEKIATIYRSFGEEIKTSRIDGRDTVRAWVGRSSSKIETIKDEANQIQVFNRDEAGNLKEAKFADDTESRRYGHDNEGRLIFAIIPAVQSRLWTYDARGNRVGETTLGTEGSMRRLVFEYDASDKLLNVKNSDDSGFLSKFRYDPKSGFLLQSTAFDSNRHFHSDVHFERNIVGLPVRTVTKYLNMDQSEVQEFVDAKTYRADGLILTRNTANQLALQYEYGLGGTVDSIQARLPWDQQQSKVLYKKGQLFADGTLQSASYGPEAWAASWLQNPAALRKESYKVCGKAGDCIIDEIYAYTGDGLLKKSTDRAGLALSNTTDFEYNLRRELTAEKLEEKAHSWDYTSGGHLKYNNKNLAQKAAHPMLPRAPEGEELVFDDLGRISTYQKIRDVRYDHGDQIQHFATADSVVDLGHHSDKRRSYKRVQVGEEVRTSFLPSHESTSGDDEQTTYIRLPGQAFAWFDHKAQHWGLVWVDTIGTPILHVSSEGSLVQKQKRSAYGTLEKEVVMEPGSLLKSSQAMDFSGARKDSESGLIDMQHRSYIAELGRFTSIDPYFLQNPEACIRDSWQNCQLYTYALNNPVSYHDPSGLSPEHSSASSPQARASRGVEVAKHERAAVKHIQSRTILGKKVAHYSKYVFKIFSTKLYEKAAKAEAALGVVEKGLDLYSSSLDKKIARSEKLVQRMAEQGSFLTHLGEEMDPQGFGATSEHPMSRSLVSMSDVKTAIYTAIDPKYHENLMKIYPWYQSSSKGL